MRQTKLTKLRTDASILMRKMRKFVILKATKMGLLTISGMTIEISSLRCSETLKELKSLMTKKMT